MLNMSIGARGYKRLVAVVLSGAVLVWVFAVAFPTNF